MIVEANGIPINYEQEGAGPDLVLLPGLGASLNVWYAQLKGLSPVLRVTAVDLRGQGLSGKPPGPYTTRLFADDVAALMATLGIQRAVVAGSSMAAAVVVALAAAHPELVSGAVLVGGFAALGPPGKEKMEARARTAETEGMAPLADMVPQMALGAYTHATNPALVGLFRLALLGNDPAAYAASCRSIVESDVTPLLGQVRCPALCVVGTQEQVAPLPAARALKAGLPDAEIRMIADAGHIPFMEQPESFNAALLEFVARLPA